MTDNKCHQYTNQQMSQTQDQKSTNLIADQITDLTEQSVESDINHFKQILGDPLPNISNIFENMLHDVPYFRDILQQELTSSKQPLNTQLPEGLKQIPGFENFVQQLSTLSQNAQQSEQSDISDKSEQLEQPENAERLDKSETSKQDEQDDSDFPQMDMTDPSHFPEILKLMFGGNSSCLASMFQTMSSEFENAKENVPKTSVPLRTQLPSPPLPHDVADNNNDKDVDDLTTTPHIPKLTRHSFVPDHEEVDRAKKFSSLPQTIKLSRNSFVPEFDQIPLPLPEKTSSPPPTTFSNHSDFQPGNDDDEQNVNDDEDDNEDNEQVNDDEDNDDDDEQDNEVYFDRQQIVLQNRIVLIHELTHNIGCWLTWLIGWYMLWSTITSHRS